jgi:hypothetical protein
MAFMLSDVVVTVNSVDLSAYVTACSFEETSNSIETTAMGDTAVSRIGGLTDGNVGISFLASFAASNVYATIEPLANTVTTVTMKPTSDATAATNPLKSVSVHVSEWPFVAGSIGDLATTEVSWPMASAVTVTTS